MREVLRLAKVSKSFGGTVVIRDLDFALRAGERHALIGPNGAGKTTLFDIISGWLAPTSGDIYVRGVKARHLDPPRVCSLGFARAFQRNMLFEGLTVCETLRLACQARHPSRRSWLLRKDRYPELLEEARRASRLMDLEDVFARQVNMLSYGQKRQLEVAIALCSQPAVLLLDEPAAGASPAERQHIVGLIQSLPAELTLLLVEHDMDVVFGVCDRITVLSYGEILATGSPQEIRNHRAVRQAYLGSSHA